MRPTFPSTRVRSSQEGPSAALLGNGQTCPSCRIRTRESRWRVAPAPLPYLLIAQTHFVAARRFEWRQWSTQSGEAFQSAGGRMSRAEIKAYIGDALSTLAAHLYACALNNPKASIHHKNTQRFFFRLPYNTFEVYDEQRHGPNVWAPVDDPVESDASDVEDLSEASITLERDLESHLVRSLDSIEPGLDFGGSGQHRCRPRGHPCPRCCRSNRCARVEGRRGHRRLCRPIARNLGWYARAGQKGEGNLATVREPNFPLGPDRPVVETR